MTQTQMLTAGAVAFAGFALWFVFRGTNTGGAAVATQPAQQQRDMGLVGWFRDLNRQETEITNRALGEYQDELRRIGVL